MKVVASSPSKPKIITLKHKNIKENQAVPLWESALADVKPQVFIMSLV
jgi:hypothetical protein